MNHKGQVLALFALLLPVLLLLASFMIDTGFAYIEMRKIENILYDTTSYGLDHIEEENINLRMDYLINRNINDTKSNIIIDHQTITISIEKKINTFFKGVNPYNQIKRTYQGSFIDGKKNIRKMG